MTFTCVTDNTLHCNDTIYIIVLQLSFVNANDVEQTVIMKYAFDVNVWDVWSLVSPNV